MLLSMKPPASLDALLQRSKRGRRRRTRRRKEEVCGVEEVEGGGERKRRGGRWGKWFSCWRYASEALCISSAKGVMHLSHVF